METFRNQAEGLDIRIADANGNQQQAAHVGYNIRPGQGFNVSLDVFNADLVTANLADVKAAANAFIAEAMAKAAEAGMPVGE